MRRVLAATAAVATALVAPEPVLRVRRSVQNLASTLAEEGRTDAQQYEQLYRLCQTSFKQLAAEVRKMRDAKQERDAKEAAVGAQLAAANDEAAALEAERTRAMEETQRAMQLRAIERAQYAEEVDVDARTVSDLQRAVSDARTLDAASSTSAVSSSSPTSTTTATRSADALSSQLATSLVEVQGSLAESSREAAPHLREFDALAQLKSDDGAALGARRDAKRAQAADAGEVLARLRSEKSEVSQALSAGEEYLQSLKRLCSDEGKRWQERAQLRNAGGRAMAEADSALAQRLSGSGVPAVSPAANATALPAADSDDVLPALSFAQVATDAGLDMPLPEPATATEETPAQASFSPAQLPDLSLAATTLTSQQPPAAPQWAAPDQPAPLDSESARTRTLAAASAGANGAAAGEAGLVQLTKLEQAVARMRAQLQSQAVDDGKHRHWCAEELRKSSADGDAAERAVRRAQAAAAAKKQTAADAAAAATQLVSLERTVRAQYAAVARARVAQKRLHAKAVESAALSERVLRESVEVLVGFARLQEEAAGAALRGSSSSPPQSSSPAARVLAAAVAGVAALGARWGAMEPDEAADLKFFARSAGGLVSLLHGSSESRQRGLVDARARSEAAAEDAAGAEQRLRHSAAFAARLARACTDMTSKLDARESRRRQNEAALERAAATVALRKEAVEADALGRGAARAEVDSVAAEPFTPTAATSASAQAEATAQAASGEALAAAALSLGDAGGAGEQEAPEAGTASVDMVPPVAAAAPAAVAPSEWPAVAHFAAAALPADSVAPVVVAEETGGLAAEDVLAGLASLQ